MTDLKELNPLLARAGLPQPLTDPAKHQAQEIEVRYRSQLVELQALEFDRDRLELQLRVMLDYQLRASSVTSNTEVILAALLRIDDDEWVNLMTPRAAIAPPPPLLPISLASDTSSLAPRPRSPRWLDLMTKGWPVEVVQPSPVKRHGFVEALRTGGLNLVTSSSTPGVR
jgi:hypothetical protein